MIGITLTFNKQMETATDDFNNPISTITPISVDDCLVAPRLEPKSMREQQSKNQMRDEIRIHLPKTFTGDVSASTVLWNGKIFQLDSDSIIFMAENTPTRWNRYFTAQYVANYAPSTNVPIDRFISEDENNYFITEDSQYYFIQEMVL